jgi:gliding motility-associated-like protein
MNVTRTSTAKFNSFTPRVSVFILMTCLLLNGWLRASAATIPKLGLPKLTREMSFPLLRLAADATRVDPGFKFISKNDKVNYASLLKEAKRYRLGLEAFRTANSFRVTSAPAILANNGVAGTIGWNDIVSNANIAGATTGQTGGGVISVSNLRNSGFDVYAKNDNSVSSTNFLMRELIGGMTGGAGASYVRVNTTTGFTPQWLELRANQGVFDLNAIKVGSADNTTALTYNFTLQALDSSFNPTGTAVTLSSVDKLTYGNFSVDSNNNFDGIFGVRITVNTGTQICVDDIEITNPRMATAPPTISSISPTAGSTAGGTAVTITGTNFTGATGVTFDGIAATGLTVNSPTSVTVNAPAGTAGVKDVMVTTPGGSATATNAYTYIGTPTITSLSPTAGSTAGGTAVTIIGTNFTGATAVTFGGVAATGLTVNSSTSVTVNAPSGTAGAKNVMVTTPGGSATATNAYAYIAPPTITSISPSSGSVAGGTFVVITGTNFTSSATVTFGGMNASVQSTSPTTITVNTPAGTVGAKDVTLTTPGGSVTSANAYNYFVNPPPIFDVYPLISDVTAINLKLSASIDKAGRFYYVILPDGATAPTSAQVKSGQNASGGEASHSGSAVISSSPFSHSFTISNLAPSTAYDIYVVAEDDASPANLMSPPVKLDVTTLSNTAPAITNLNGDSVAWPGVGNTVTLDAGGNATVTDIELDASNWNGARLTVQRINTPLVSDIFSFNESGYSVSGGNLQTGGSTTFGTFTNANGVLAISFNTNATNTVVRDVVRGIQYRNNTPAGHVTIRFTLRDGSSSVDADVNVTSDFIYVTNTIDNATINLVDGVSFSEAVAIAAADVTGSQTIKIATTLATQTVSTSAASTLNENLTLDLSSANGVTFSGGSLAIAPSVALTITNAATNTTTFATALTGPGSLTKQGTGTLVLNGTNTTYTGSVTVGQGVLTVAHNNALGTTTNGVTVSSGASLRVANGITITDALNLSGDGDNASGALQLLSGAATVSGNINLSSTVVRINSAGALSISGIISGTNLASTGTGSLILSGTNTYGNTTVSAGTLSVANDNNLGFTQITLASGTTLAVTGATTIDNGITLTGAATISNTANVTIDGVISGGHNLTKTGSGVLTLARDNTYAATNVDAGTLIVSSDSNLGSDAITLAAGTTLTINDATTIDNAIALTGAATINSTANATISGVISGPHNLGKTGAGRLTLAASNTYSGNTIVSAGGLTLTGGSSIGDGSAVSVASGATLTLGAGNETIGSLLGDGNVVLGSNLTTGGNNASTTFSGVILGIGNGITKTGSGTFTLSGSNAYTGSTTVNAGTLALSGAAAIHDTSAVTVSNGATLSLNASETVGSLAGAGNVSLNGFTLSSGGNNTSTTFSGVLNGSGGFTKTGSGTLTLSGTNSSSFTGGTTVSGGGTLSVASDDNLGAGTLSIDNSVLSITGATTIDNSIALTNSATINNTAAATLSGAFSGSGSLSKAGNGQLSLTGTSNYGGSTTVSAGALAVNGALNGTSAVSVSSGATLTGSGSVTNLNVNSGGTLSPGNGTGVFTVNGNLQMNSGSALTIDINGATAGTGYDQVIVNGTASLAGNLVVNHGYSPGQGDIYTIIVNDMADLITGTFSGLTEGATLTAGGNGTVLTASYIGGTGNDFTLTAPLNAAPVIGNLNGDSVSFIEDSAHALLDANSDATVTDHDSVDFDGGNVTVSITNNRVNTEDVLSIRNQGTAAGQIGTSGLNITFGGTVIGTRTANGGTGTNDLVITLNVAADAVAVQALIRNLIYINTNTTEPATTARTIRVTVNDGDGGNSTSAAANISVAVIAVNDVPTLTATGATPTFTEGGAAVGLFSGTNISTVESGQLINSLVFTVTNLGNGNSEQMTIDGTIVPLVNGISTTAINALSVNVAIVGTTATVTISKVGGITVVTAQILINGFKYANTSLSPTIANRVVTLTSIQDNGGTANGGVDTSTLNVSATVTIVAVNNAPVISGTPATSVSQDQAYSFIPTASDVDVNDVLTFSIVNKPTWANFNTATGALTGTPTNANVGTTTGIVISVSDGALSADLPVFNLTVININDAPTISGVPATSVDQDATYSFTPTASDIDVGDILTFSIINKPTWASFNTATGALTGTPTKADVGVNSGIVISVSDGILNASLPAFNLTVEPVNYPPTITGSAATSVKPGEMYSFQPSAGDVDGDQLTFSITNKPSWANFNPATGALSGTPLRSNEGVYNNIVISVTDGTASVSLPAFAIEVKSAPMITGISFTGGNFVYDGTAKSLAISGTLPAGVTVTYSNNAKTAAGSYTVTANISGGTVYQDQTLTAQLTINKAPLTITVTNTTMCQGANLPTFTVNYSGFIAGETESSLSTRPNVSTTANSSSAAGNYVITPSGAIANNYEITYVNATLTINPLPVVVITSDKGLSVAKGETVTLTATGGTSYQWSNASGIVSGQNTAVLSVRPTANTTYTVTARNATGCSSTQSITIQVTEEAVAAKPTNIMSPNGDGVNDKWVIENLDLYPNNEVIVVDRSGRTIYSKKGYDNSWDATLRGLPLSEGTYYYIINYGDGKTPAKKGFITILNKR